MKFSLFFITWIILFSIFSPAFSQEIQGYHQWTAPFEYHGPGREIVEGEQNPATIRVGVLTSLSGGGAQYGIAMREGANLARDEINAAGGVLGKPLQLIYRDDQNDMGENGHQTVKLIFDDKVWAIIGSVHSGCTHVAARITLKAEIPQLTTVSTDPTVQMIGSPWMFRCLADDNSQGKAIAGMVFDKSGLKRVGLFQQENRYGKMGGKAISRIAELKQRPLIFKNFFESGQKDFTEQLDVVRRERPDAIIIWGLYSESAGLVKALRGAGLDFPIFGADGMVSPEFIKLAGDAAEGTIVTYPFDDTRNDPVTKRFIGEFNKKYRHQPDSFSAHAYDAVYLMARAIRIGGLNKARIRDALAATKEFPGATGAISFDKFNDDPRDVIFARIENGKFVPVKN